MFMWAKYLHFLYCLSPTLMQFAVPMIQKLGGLLMWMMTTDLFNFGTDLQEVENFAIRVSADFMTKDGTGTRDLLYAINTTTQEVLADIVGPLEQYLYQSDDGVKGLLTTMMARLKGSTRYVEYMWSNYFIIKKLFLNNSVLLSHRPLMAQPENLFR